MDQASRLREMAQTPAHRVIAVLSGKGGVGKTNIALSLALLARRSFPRVLLWDGDFGLANCDILLDLSPEYSIVDVLRGEVSLAEALVRGPDGIQVLAAGSGVRESAAFAAERRGTLLELLDRARRSFEIVVFDGPAGIGDNVINLALKADSIVLVTTPEVPAVADAYATLKVLYQAGCTGGVELVVNMATDAEEAARIGGRLGHVAARFLGVEVPMAGWVPLDHHVTRAVSLRRPFLRQFPECNAARAVEALWRRMGSSAPACAGGVR